MTETDQLNSRYTHNMFYTFDDFSLNTVQISIHSVYKIDNIELLKRIADEKFTEDGGDLPPDWTFLKCEMKEYAPINKNETTIDGIKLRIIDSADELKKEFEYIKPDLSEQFTINNKHYYRADAPNGETLAVLESVLFGDPATLDYFLCRVAQESE